MFEAMARAVLGQVNVIVSDMAAAVAFYGRLGWDIATPTEEHAVAKMPNGMRVEFDTQSFSAVWDSSSDGTTGGSTVLVLNAATREDVDVIYRDLVAHGGRPRQPPYDAFWGSRFAIVEDPDGNPVGLMSPTDEARRSWPPAPAPRHTSS
jgi:uncharacterized glyoxalase superfamily protein PhnB